MLNKRFINIDIFRIFLAILVVSIHSIVIDQNIDFYIKDGIARLAVPMFFMMIGMQLPLDKITDRTFVKKYSISQSNIFLPWISLFVVISLFDILNSNSLNYVGIFFTPFWFVIASCFSLLYINILLKFFNFRAIFILSFALHIFGILGDAYYA